MPAAVVIWIWFCAYLNCAGWALSALHQLNAGGYAAAFATGLAAIWFWKIKTGAQFSCGGGCAKIKNRFRRGFPLAFLVLAAMAAIGGAIHSPANLDGLAYRTPRVLHWLAVEQWQWIHTDFQRLNTRTAGFEWVTAPQFVFFHTDRLVFLINVVSFLLLPGRIFAVLTRLGVGPRAAWHWMWIFPAGYGYALQAGSYLNDMFGAVLTLAAFEYALRARKEISLAAVAAAALAAALMTAVKAFNLVLLLPWAVAILPAWKIILRRPVAVAALAVFAASASLLPTAVANWRACGDWTGLKAEQAAIGGGAEIYRLYANTLSITCMNLVPPVFPFAHQWRAFMDKVTPPGLAKKLHDNMELGLAENQLPDMQAEEVAGLGCGVSLLLLALLAWKLKNSRRQAWPGLGGLFRFEFQFFCAVWVAAIVVMMKSGASGPPRYFLPVYPLLMLPVLDAGGWFRRGLWRTAVWAIFISTAVLLVTNPQRPLWPAVTVLRHCGGEQADSKQLQRAWAVYSVYGVRGDAFAPVLEKIPAGIARLGFVAADEPETSLWRPFGSREVINIRRDDGMAWIRNHNVRVAIISVSFLEQLGSGVAARWVAEHDAEVLETFQLKLRAGKPAGEWWLVRFRDGP